MINGNIFSLSLITVSFFLLGACVNDTDSFTTINGLQDTDYLEASIEYENASPSITLKKPFMILEFQKPPEVPEGSSGNELALSFVIEKSAAQNNDNPYYDRTSVYLIFNINLDSDGNETLTLTGITYNHCESPCASVINSVKDQNGNDLFDFEKNIPIVYKIKPTSQPNKEQRFTLKIGIDPIHQKDVWTIRQGYPGKKVDLYLLLFPFYKKTLII